MTQSPPDIKPGEFQRQFAPYACLAAETRGRLIDESGSRTRTPFQRDKDRIIHSGAFRKLKYKTQVFVYHEGDYYRTRLTHSLEVAQIARSISRYFGLDEDLAEGVALSHDLGHTPFGHAGEDAMQEAMRDYGGFDHNDQALRIVTRLENRYADYDGLNLSWETLEGLIKHNGPLIGTPDKKSLPPSIAAFQQQWDLWPYSWPSMEAQIAALADDIAYNSHDLDDGLRAQLFDIEDIRQVPMLGRILQQIEQRYGTLERPRLIHETIRRVMDVMVNDLFTETERRLRDINPRHADEVRRAPHAIVAYSDTMRKDEKELRQFLWHNMYRHYKVNRVTSKARRIIRQLFDLFFAEPNILPTEWQKTIAEQPGDAWKARIICDYIAGMTDRYAMAEHRRLFDLSL
jgi:dGTPase